MWSAARNVPYAASALSGVVIARPLTSISVSPFARPIAWNGLSSRTPNRRNPAGAPSRVWGTTRGHGGAIPP